MPGWARCAYAHYTICIFQRICLQFTQINIFQLIISEKFRSYSILAFMRVEEEVNDGHLLQLGTSSHDFQKSGNYPNALFTTFT